MGVMQFDDPFDNWRKKIKLQGIPCSEMCIEICLQCTARAVITHRETSSLSFADILTKNDLLYRNGTSHSLLDPLMPHVLDRWCADG